MRFSFPTALQTLLKIYGSLMTYHPSSDYCPCKMEGWQYKAAFVIQFRPETDIETGRLEGRVEHVSSSSAMRFHSLDELLAFMASMLAEVDSPDEP